MTTTAALLLKQAVTEMAALPRPVEHGLANRGGGGQVVEPRRLAVAATVVDHVAVCGFPGGRPGPRQDGRDKHHHQEKQATANRREKDHIGGHTGRLFGGRRGPGHGVGHQLAHLLALEAEERGVGEAVDVDPVEDEVDADDGLARLAACTRHAHAPDLESSCPWFVCN